MESPAVLRPCRRLKLARGVKDKEHLHASEVQDCARPSLTSGSSLIWCCSVLGRGTGTLPQLPGLLAE